MNTRPRSSRIGIILLVCLSLISCASIEGITSPYTPSEKKLIKLAERIRETKSPPGSDFSSPDRRVGDLMESAKKVWAGSPRNSNSVTASGNLNGFEIIVVYRAVVDYYQVTGRPGLATPVLEEAIQEAYSLRYYSQWQELNLELITIYQHLGLLDHARDRISIVLRFFKRVRMTLDELPSRLDLNTVIFVTLHTTQLRLRPEAYTDPAVLRQLYDLLERSATQTAQSWGWSPEVGFRATPIFAPYAIRAAELGDLGFARKVRSDVAKAHLRNRTVDPFAVANEMGLDYVSTRLGRDIHRIVETPFAAAHFPFTVRLSQRSPAEKRYVAQSEFREAMDLARIDLALQNSDGALVWADLAQANLPRLRKLYERLGRSIASQDGFDRTERVLGLLRAEALESLGRCDEAGALYEDHIEWSERERASLPPALRIHFFRGVARAAYQASIRCSLAGIDAANPVPGLDIVLAKAERLRARGFQDLLGVQRDSQSPVTVSDLRAKLSSGMGVLQILDLDTQLATILVTDQDVNVETIEKPRGWETEIFRLRNQLATATYYDQRGFTALGRRLLGSVSSELAGLSTIIATSEGPLSALPLGIIPFQPGRLLQDQARLTLVPSLALWTSGAADTEAASTRSRRALVLADPVFADAPAIEEAIGSERLATRGSNALAYFQPLPETADEARAVIRALGNADENTLWLGDEATESRLKAKTDLATYSHLHFATHAVVGNDLPNLTEPALILAWEDGEDGFLTAREVAALDLNARLTVLSACNTGNGEYFAGEGLMGMGRAFMEAGSERVVVSLWPVESFSTKLLMEFFYGHLREGHAEDEALWLAQQDLRALESESSAGEESRGIAISNGGSGGSLSRDKPFDNPFYWSPFVLISRE